MVQDVIHQQYHHKGLGFRATTILGLFGGILDYITGCIGIMEDRMEANYYLGFRAECSAFHITGFCVDMRDEHGSLMFLEYNPSCSTAVLHQQRSKLADLHTALSKNEPLNSGLVAKLLVYP